ncbi:MAG: glutamine--fructose-6-phosphate transaminase (isomerizing) [Chloroflexi bacterium]|nr:glutamine--fructose-6-phosphate transaminase (isomerizing) [Chloroflexota bacterium]
MCGVFGFVGQPTDVGNAVLTALKTLEYRGYDSWGLALSAADHLLIDKDVGRINGRRRVYPISSQGIGHTRWATHGGVVAANAHPHVDCFRRIAVVHNGIIENHAELRSALESRGHKLESDTDSDVVAHLVEEELAAGRDLGAAVSNTFSQLDGYNAVVVMDRLQQRFVAAKRVSPLVIGLGEYGSTVASDAIALHDHADELVYLEDDQLAVLHARGVDLYDRSSMRQITPISRVQVGPREDIDRGDYPDFLSKEVSEQPEALRRLVREARDEIQVLADAVRASGKVIFVGCGTAGNAAAAGAYLFSEICGHDVTIAPASEFRYRSQSLGPEALVVALSQSGETVDVLDAMAEARNRGARLAAIVNTPRSTLDRSVETRVLLRTGTEQCVLATKSYTAMLATLLLTASAVAGRSSAGSEAVLRAADAIDEVLVNGTRERIRGIATTVARSEHLFVIGRGVHYPSALEAALKIKEVSYIHAEGFAAGELKHGVIALVEPGTPCVVLCPDDQTRTDILSGAAELKSRGGHMIGVGSIEDPIFDDFIPVPDAGIANPLVEAIPGQLLGYFAALERGNDPDRPRNLAKSVTVK